MRQSPGERYSIELLGKHHDRATFSCGVEPLDRYLQRQAGQDVRRGFAAVFVAVERDSRSLHGYYALSMAGVALDLVPEGLKLKMPRYPSVPAVRLGRLAVAAAARGQRLGTLLLLDAMRRALANEIAWAAFIVDAKDGRAKEFYRQFGFRSFLDDENRLFLARATIEPLFLGAGGPDSTPGAPATSEWRTRTRRHR